jgi:hypothetical protein
MEPLHPFKLLASSRIEGTIIVQNVDKLELVPHPHLVIVGIVRGGHLDRSGAKGHVHGDRVGDDGDATVEEGVQGKFAVEVLLVKVGGESSAPCLSLGSAPLLIAEKENPPCTSHHQGAQQ